MVGWGGNAVKGVSPLEWVKEEALDGCGNGNVREDVVGVTKDASGWTIGWVVFAWYVLSAEVKLLRKRLYKVVDAFENFVGRRVAVMSIAPAFDDFNVVAKKGKSRVGKFEGGNCIDE